jgi:hypothetical protein
VGIRARREPHSLKPPANFVVAALFAQTKIVILTLSEAEPLYLSLLLSLPVLLVVIPQRSGGICCCPDVPGIHQFVYVICSTPS